MPVIANSEQITSKMMSRAFSAFDILPPYIFKWHTNGNMAAMEYEKHDPNKLYLNFKTNEGQIKGTFLLKRLPEQYILTITRSNAGNKIAIKTTKALTNKRDMSCINLIVNLLLLIFAHEG